MTTLEPDGTHDRRGPGVSVTIAAVAVPAVLFLLLGAGIVLGGFHRAGGSRTTLSLPWAIGILATTAVCSALLFAAFFTIRHRLARSGRVPVRTGIESERAAPAPAGTADERRLRRSVLAEVVECVSDAVLVVERDAAGLRIRATNRAAAELVGIPAVEMVGAPVGQFLHDARGLLQRLEEKGEFRDRGGRAVTALGETRDVRISARPLVAEAGDADDPPAWLFVIANVTELRREENRRAATLRISEVVQTAETPMELFRGIESVLRGATTVDSFHAIGVDQASDRLTIAYSSEGSGLPEHELSRGLTGYVLTRDAAVILNAEQIRHLVLRGDVVADEPVAENWAAAPVRMGPGIHGVLVVQNHTPHATYHRPDVDLVAVAAAQVAAWFHRRRGEDERKRLVAAVEQAVDAILVLDENGVVEYANPAFAQQTGFAPEEAKGLTLEQIWGSTVLDVPVAAVLRMVREGRTWSGLAKCGRKAAMPFLVQATISSVTDADGRLAQHVVVQHDVSHERELEEQLRQAQKMEAVGILAGGVAHDFNNLLSVIQGYGEIARAAAHDADAVSALEQVLVASKRAAAVVSQLLAFSRRHVVEPRPLDLTCVVRDVRAMIERLIGEDIELVIETRDDLDLVEADAHKFEQVLMNLVVNARDAMPHGGRLVITTTTEQVDAERAESLPGLEPGPHVLLSVSDTGGGMPPDVRSRIFEPFFTTKPKGQGTGLGLSTVYAVVTQAGGHISVQSEEGRGTTFLIHLPSIGRASALAEAGTETEPTTAGTETVLLVEDESALRGFVERILTKRGYRVLVASNGNEALELARANGAPLDLLLTDVVMPRLNGSALAATLIEEHPRMAVLFMTGYPDQSIASYGVLDPDVDLLQKPFTSTQILKRVRRAIDSKGRAAGSARRRLLPMP